MAYRTDECLQFGADPRVILRHSCVILANSHRPDSFCGFFVFSCFLPFHQPFWISRLIVIGTSSNPACALKDLTSWDITLCCYVLVPRRFGMTFCLRHQDANCVLIGLFFDTKDETVSSSETSANFYNIRAPQVQILRYWNSWLLQIMS
jgi:hypothetical protein